MNVYLMAQGKGMRWWDHSRRYPRFILEAPPYKQLLEVGNESLLYRSSRLFREHGCTSTVVAERDLIQASEVGYPGITLITLEYPGDEVLRGVLSLMDERPPRRDQVTIIALGDVLFSHKAIDDLVSAARQQPWGCMGRVEPNPVSNKTADEVFAIWYSADLWPEVGERIRMMTARGNTFHLLKPWRLPYVVSPDPERTIREFDKGRRLEAIRDNLLTTDDYTDDIDSPEEWLLFWDKLCGAAIEEDGKIYRRRYI